jgi:hypothetical protein
MHLGPTAQPRRRRTQEPPLTDHRATTWLPVLASQMCWSSGGSSSRLALAWLTTLDAVLYLFRFALCTAAPIFWGCGLHTGKRTRLGTGHSRCLRASLPGHSSTAPGCGTRAALSYPASPTQTSKIPSRLPRQPTSPLGHHILTDDRPSGVALSKDSKARASTPGEYVGAPAEI